jgi:hypothetical protein
MGYPLLFYSNPSGLDDGVAWINASSSIERGNFFVASGLDGRVRVYLFERFDHYREIVRVGLTNATQIVDHYLKYMIDNKAPAAVRTSLIDYMNRVDAGARPFDINNPTHVREKVTGLVHLISALPEYSIN